MFTIVTIVLCVVKNCFLTLYKVHYIYYSSDLPGSFFVGKFPSQYLAPNYKKHELYFNQIDQLKIRLTVLYALLLSSTSPHSANNFR